MYGDSVAYGLGVANRDRGSLLADFKALASEVDMVAVGC